MMKVLVTGAKGQLGMDVVRALKDEGMDVCGIDIDDLDICDRELVLQYISSIRPETVVHCAAFTAVDLAEDEKERCFLVNAVGTENIALSCQEVGAKMVYISTDYVFPGDGKTPYESNDCTKPVNVYGESKRQGEINVQKHLTRYFIVRISWVFGIHGNNFVKTMLRLGKEKTEIKVVKDQIGSPTYTVDLAALLCRMVQTDRYGVYHATNEGFCSFAEFAEHIFHLAKLPVKVHPVESSEYVTKAGRPLNSRLSKKSLDDAGLNRLPHWKDALERFIRQ